MGKMRQAGHLSGFVDETEIHGIRKVFGSRSMLRRGVWLTVFAIATIAMFYFLYNGFLAYASARVTTETSLIVSDEIPFPTLTVCSIDELDIRKSKDAFLTNVLDYTDKYGIENMASLNGICNNATIVAQMASHPDVPLFIRHIIKFGGCEMLKGEVAELTATGAIYNQVKGAFLNLDKVLDVTLYPVKLSKDVVQKTFATLESTYNALAKAFPGPIPTTHDVKKVISDTAGHAINVAQDFSTNILKAPGTVLSRVGKRRRRRREALLKMNQTISLLQKRKSLVYGRYIRQVTKIQNYSTCSPGRLHQWRKKRSFIKDTLKNFENQVLKAYEIVDMLVGSSIEYIDAQISKTTFDMDTIIRSCEWIDNTGAITDCKSSIKPRLFVGFGKCFSINDIVGEKRFKGNSMTAQIRVTLAQLPLAKTHFGGVVELPNDYSYRAYISIPGDALPENENYMYRVKEDDVHVFNVENYGDVTMVRTDETPCLNEDEYGHLYHRENCIRDCIRLELRALLGCWLYDTERYLMDRHKDSFRESDRAVLEEEDLAEAGSICDRNATTEAIEIRSTLSNCTSATKCPLACKYESFDVEHVISQRTSEVIFRNSTDPPAKTILSVRQKRTTIQRQKQVLAFSFFNLLAEIGGNMGLCIGASLLTVCHIFEFVIVDLIVGGLSGLWSRRSPAHQVGATDSGKGRIRKDGQGSKENNLFPGMSVPSKPGNLQASAKANTSPQLSTLARLPDEDSCAEEPLRNVSYDMGKFSQGSTPLPRPEDIY